MESIRALIRNMRRTRHEAEGGPVSFEGRLAMRNVWAVAETRRYLMHYVRPQVDIPQMTALRSVIPEIDIDSSHAERVVFDKILAFYHRALDDGEIGALRSAGEHDAAAQLAAGDPGLAARYPDDVAILTQEIRSMLFQIPEWDQSRFLNWDGRRSTLLSAVFGRQLPIRLANWHRNEPDVYWRWIRAFPALHELHPPTDIRFHQIMARVRNGGHAGEHRSGLTHRAMGASSASTRQIALMASELQQHFNGGDIDALYERIAAWITVLGDDDFRSFSHMIESAMMVNRGALALTVDDMQARSGLFDDLDEGTAPRRWSI